MATQTAIHTPPPKRVTGYHKWRDLLFLHWRVDPALLQSLLPPELTVETFDGWAWVGVVAFDMHGVRPWWFPPIPGVSAFHETNVRTYVNRDGDVPGVWFFSLDAANSLAVRVARWRWHLNYYRAQMTLQRTGDHITYSSERLWPGNAEASYAISADISAAAGTAAPGTFDEFLVERYVLYSQDRGGRLFSGRVYHEPYPLRKASLQSCRQSLTDAAGIPVTAPPAHVAFSDGVDVEIGALLLCDE